MNIPAQPSRKKSRGKRFSFCGAWAIFFFSSALNLTASTWSDPAVDGSWQDPAHWTGGVPSLAGDSAEIILSSSELKRIYLEDDITLKSLSFTPQLNDPVFFEGRGHSVLLDSGSPSTPVISLSFNALESYLVLDAAISSTNIIGITTNGNTKADFRGGLVSSQKVQATFRSTTASDYLKLGMVTAPFVTIDGQGAGTVSVSLGSSVNQLQISGGTFTGKTRIEALSASSPGGVQWGGGDLEIATSVVGAQIHGNVTGKDLRLAEGGQITIGGSSGVPTLAANTDLVTAGGDILQTNASGAFGSGRLVVESGSSKIRLTNSSIGFGTYSQSDREGVVVIESATLGAASKIIFAGAPPTLTGSGAVGSAQVGIISGIVTYDGTSQYNFATYEAPAGVRALAAAETTTTLAAGNNVRLTSSGSSSYVGAINSLYLQNSTLDGSGVFSISSGMIITGGTASSSLNKTLTRSSDLQVYNSQQLTINNSTGTGDIIKSGTGDLYWNSNNGEDFIVNEGKLIITNGNHDSATVRSGGILRTYLSAGFTSSTAQIHLDEGGIWEMDNGTIQRVEGLSGGGKVQGKGTSMNTLQFSADNGDILDTVLEGKLRIELIGGSGQTMSWVGAGSSHTGDTQLGSVRLELSDNGTLSSASNLRLLGTSVLDLQGSSQTVNGLQGDATAAITSENTLAPATLTVNVGNGNSFQYAGDITNGVNLVKTGMGTQTIGGTTGLGTVLVQQGALRILGSSNTYGSQASFQVKANSVLLISSEHAGPLANDIALESGALLDWTLVNPSATDHELNFRHLNGKQTEAGILALAANSGEVNFSFQTSADSSLHSDILQMAGVTGAAGDIFVLQLSYDPSYVLGAGEYMQLGWNDNEIWKNAILGNSTSADTFIGDRAWTEADLVLGNWGYDSTNHVAWAVLNHNSQFAVMAVPEPSTYVMLSLGLGLTVLFHARRNKLKTLTGTSG